VAGEFLREVPEAAADGTIDEDYRRSLAETAVR
jgi:hypothetical protein